MNTRYFFIGIVCSSLAIAVSLWKGKTLNFHMRGSSEPWIISRAGEPVRFWIGIGVFVFALAINARGVAGVLPG